MKLHRWILALLVGLTLVGSAEAQEKGVLVFAAASLKNALDEAIAAYGQETGTGHRVLCRELGAGQADRAGRAGELFISADLAWMDYLAERG